MSGTRVLRLDVAYDGTHFHGWQRQPGLRTVQGDVEVALRDVLGTPVTLAAAGRTDAGVHAHGQVASFRADTSLPARAIGPLANKRLPRDVRVRRSLEAGAEFHARHSARGRHYRYLLLDHEDVQFERFAWFPRRAYRPEGLAAALSPIPGEHDFSAFGAAGSSPVNPVCRVSRAQWSRWEYGWRLDVEADHFLYHMVRNLVATALQASVRPDPGAYVRDILVSRDRHRAGATAPAHGLSLEAVRYENEEAS